MLAPSESGSFYMMALALAVVTLVVAYAIPKSRLGLGLYAIHDDEDAAEVMGVPTYRYKLVAFAISCALAGVAGGIQSLFVSYVTAGSTFNITVPLTVDTDERARRDAPLGGTGARCDGDHLARFTRRRLPTRR